VEREENPLSVPGESVSSLILPEEKIYQAFATSCLSSPNQGVPLFAWDNFPPFLKGAHLPSSGAASEAWSLFPPSNSPPTPALHSLPGFYGNRLGRLCQKAKATTVLEGRRGQKLRVKSRK
jgi:hypothetical protein